MNDGPKFIVQEPVDPNTGQVVYTYVIMDPGDGRNYQTYPMMRISFDSANDNYVIERQTYSLATTKQDKDSAIKEAIKLLTADWAAGI